VFGDARYRATREALNEARAADEAAVASRADEATLIALKNAFLEAQKLQARPDPAIIVQWDTYERHAAWTGSQPAVQSEIQTLLNAMA
jgi:hypothetical protein